MKPINVKDVCDPMQTLSVIVYADEPLEDVLRRFSEESWLRASLSSIGPGGCWG